MRKLKVYATRPSQLMNAFHRKTGAAYAKAYKYRTYAAPRAGEVSNLASGVWTVAYHPQIA